LLGNLDFKDRTTVGVGLGGFVLVLGLLDAYSTEMPIGCLGRHQDKRLTFLGDAVGVVPNSHAALSPSIREEDVLNRVGRTVLAGCAVIDGIDCLERAGDGYDGCPVRLGEGFCDGEYVAHGKIIV
jgi:hypothetical protein